MKIRHLNTTTWKHRCQMVDCQGKNEKSRSF